MPRIAEIMSTPVQTTSPEESLRSAAQCMQSFNVGALPVCTGGQLLGMLTDRDIAVRAVAQGLDADEACVSDVMTQEVQFCTLDQDSQDAMRLMGQWQVRRLPVVDAKGSVVGIVALADVALRQSAHIDQTVREISEPRGGAPQAQAAAAARA